MTTSNETQNTVQTVQEAGLLGEALPQEQKKRHSEELYEIAQDEEGWHWALWSANGQIIARNGRPYDSRQQVLAAVRLVKSRAGRAEKIVVAS